jgi:hypothetical protein
MVTLSPYLGVHARVPHVPFRVNRIVEHPVRDGRHGNRGAQLHLAEKAVHAKGHVPTVRPAPHGHLVKVRVPGEGTTVAQKERLKLPNLRGRVGGAEAPTHLEHGGGAAANGSHGIDLYHNVPEGARHVLVKGDPVCVHHGLRTWNSDRERDG